MYYNLSELGILKHFIIVTCIFTELLWIPPVFAEQSGMAVGEKVPDFTLPDLNNNEIHLQDIIIKEKYTFIIIWGVWCPYCRAIMVKLKQSYGEYKEAGLGIVAVSIMESPFKVKMFIDQLNPPFPVLVDEWGDLKDPYQVKDVPRVVLVNRQGIIQYMDITTSPEKIRLLIKNIIGR